MITEFVFLLYDQFYLLEEMQLRLFSFKFFELSFFFLLFFLNVSQLVSLEFLLFIVFIARLIALLLTALDAYFRWELVPLRTTFFSRSFIFTSFLLIGFLLFVVLLRSIGFVL